MTDENSIKKHKNWLKTYQLAVALYSCARGFDAADERIAEKRLIAVLLAATWLDAEGGMPDPWVSDNQTTAIVSRERFLEWATEVWDGWARARAGGRPTLVLVSA